MKHLIMILFVVVLGYVLWTTIDKCATKSAIRATLRHGIRLVGLALVVYLLLAASVQFASPSII